MDTMDVPGPLAQLVERHVYTVDVVGSIPAGPTTSPFMAHRAPRYRGAVNTSSRAATPPTFDAGPLTEPVSSSAVQAFARQLRGSRADTTGTAFIWAVGVLVVLLASAALVMLFQAIGNPLVIGILTVGIAAIIVAVLRIIAVTGRRNSEMRYRLSRFAAVNDMEYVDRVLAPSLPGMIFSYGADRMATDVLRTKSRRAVEFGNYQCIVKKGKRFATHHWGYVAMKLNVSLPNIVLDGVANDSVVGTTLPTSFRDEQRLSLEGDFDQHFSLYCPVGYERDALYLFTPDVMADFIDTAAHFDVEIIDDWLFLYARHHIATMDLDSWTRTFATVSALVAKLDQWERWRDDRARAGEQHPVLDADPITRQASVSPPAPSTTVAPLGRRLRRKRNWTVLIVAIAFATLGYVIQIL